MAVGLLDRTDLDQVQEEANLLLILYPAAAAVAAILLVELAWAQFLIQQEAGGYGGETSMGSPPAITSDAFPTHGGNIGTIGTIGTGTMDGIPYPTGGRYSNGTISTNGRSGSAGSESPSSLDALLGNAGGVAVD
ncbi:MAG: hypothetical protein L6R41_001705 [Letrouitia leprolyta]|nr:MAG: hypothetical protein L6R41_001705 [Letrouitia leprolyta]